MKIILECYELDYIINCIFSKQKIDDILNKCEKRCDEYKKEDEQNFKRDGREI